MIAKRYAIYMIIILLLRYRFVMTARKMDNMLHNGYTNGWVVHIKDGSIIAPQIAEENKFVYHGQLGDLKDFYYLEHKEVSVHSKRPAHDVHAKLAKHPKILWLQQQKIQGRFRRGYFTDPFYEKQWYLENKGANLCPGDNIPTDTHDINVIPVWKQNITGKGVVVSILDDGVEHTHPDLRDNFDFGASTDINGNDFDPMPRYTFNNINNHGTRCAGQVAALPNNNICGAGVAFHSKLGGIRMLDGKITDAIEAKSLSYHAHYIDIYSISWGPSDGGSTVDGPGRLALKALKDGIKRGRSGLGSIFVWATGNGGRYGDYCSCDGYINSPYTIAIGAVDVCGSKPWYAEECPGTLAVTYGSKAAGDFSTEITTTDLRGSCTTRHTGSSAAAPLAAGIFALVLEANPQVTWRDLQHLIVWTSKIVSPNDESWIVSRAGHVISEKFGFGALDAGALVEAARAETWETSPTLHVCRTYKSFVNLPLRSKRSVVTTLEADGCRNMKNCVTKLEHVQVIVYLQKSFSRGKLEIFLISPTGTRSPILKRRPRDHTSSRGFREWAFLTVFHWDENPSGVWTLQVNDHSWSGGRIYSWYMKFYGTGTCERPRQLPVTKTKHLSRDITVYVTVFLILLLIAVLVLGTKYFTTLVKCLYKVSSRHSTENNSEQTHETQIL